jgi:hypothetical protein
LGEHGALAIQREMLSMNCPVVPALRTINLILQMNGCVDGTKRIRYKSPPRAWYLPEVACGDAELDCYDYVEDLRLEGKNGYTNIFNGISLHGGLVCSFPMVRMTAENTVFSLLEHWKQFGCPTYAQFDNSTVFTGSRHPNSIGKVIRLCLSLDVILFLLRREKQVFKQASNDTTGYGKKASGNDSISKIINNLLNNRKNRLKRFGTKNMISWSRHRNDMKCRMILFFITAIRAKEQSCSSNEQTTMVSQTYLVTVGRLILCGQTGWCVSK